MDEIDRNQRLLTLRSVFRPAGPVNREDLFSGRRRQLSAVGDAQMTVGQHAVIYGERGVGKTSLAAVSAEVCIPRGVTAVRVNCDSSDNFSDLWNKVVDELPIAGADLQGDRAAKFEAAAESATEVIHFGESVGPNQARLALRRLSVAGAPLIFFDEFDQLSDPETIRLMSNTIKMLSDQLEQATLVIVGVADNVEELIVGHKSIERNVVQIEMPRMSSEELQEIVTRGLEAVGMDIEPSALRFVGILPRGLPQYAHLLAQEGAQAALADGRTTVTIVDLLRGLSEGLAKVDRSLARSYHNATSTSHKKNNTFPAVLLACAMAPVDDLGFFQPADLRGPYSRVRQKPQDIPNFNPQLTQLAVGRGHVLEREGEERKWRYRFCDPLMEPYILLRGLEEGAIKPEDF